MHWVIVSYIMEEFKEIVGQTKSLEDVVSQNWHKWQAKVLSYAALSNKVTIKEITA